MQPDASFPYSRAKSWANWHKILPWFVWLGALILYSLTAAPSIVALFDDSLEFQLVGPTFAIAHPTGYPLYTLLGGLWSRGLFPFGNWAWRMNLFSALSGAAAVAVLFLLARRLSRSNWAGLAAAVTFALGPVWWSQTTIAEVYALHGLFVATILYVAVRLPIQERHNGQPHNDGGTQRSTPRLTPLFLLLGLALTHHRTTLLLLPGLALYLLWTIPGVWRPRRAWGRWAVGLLLPLLLYLYIPVRAAMGAHDLNGDYVNSWTGFWSHVLATGYTGYFRANPQTGLRQAGYWLALFRDQFGWFGLLLGGSGLLAGLARRRMRPAWWLVAIVFLTNLIFALNYQVADVAVFLIPVFLCLALGVGHGVALLGQIVPFIGNRRTSWLGLGVQAGAVATLALGLGGRGPAVDRSQDWAVHDYAVAMAKVDFPPQSRVVGLVGQMTALRYMQRSQELARNAVPVALDDPAQRRAFVEKAVAAGWPVYLTQELDGIETNFSFSGQGPLVRVWPRGEAEPGWPTHPLDVTLADGMVRLVGYDLVILQQAGGPAARIAFYWQPATGLTQRLKLSLRLQTRNGAPLVWPDGRVATEDRFPLRQVAPSWSWLPGEVVRDVHTLRLPVAPSRTSIRLLVIVYDAESLAEVGRWSTAIP